MNKIYCFSGTGNSLYIAKIIEEKLENTQVILIEDVLRVENKIIIEDERVGFIFPVYFAKLPVVIEKFLDRVERIEGDYTFALIAGGGLFGSILKVFEKKLLEKGSKLDGGYLVKMPSNHPKIAQMQKKSNEVLLREAKEQVEKVLGDLKDKKNNKLVISPRIIGGLITRYAFSKPYEQSQRGTLDQVFSVEDSCDLCGKCVEFCPVNNISIEDGCLKWLHGCLNCARCYHICPKEAIQFADDTMERYFNPFVDMEVLKS